MRILETFVSFWCVTSMLGAAPTYAQTTAAPITPQTPSGPPPPGPLFGGGPSRAPQSLTAGLSLSGGYDRDRSVLTLGPNSQVTGDVVRSGRTATGGAHLNYTLSRGLFSMGVSGSSSAYYLARLGSRVRTTSSVSANTSLALLSSPRTSLQVTQQASFTPLSILQPSSALLQSGFEGSVDFDDSWLFVSDHQVRFGTGMSFDRQLSRRSSFGGSYQYSRSTSAHIGGYNLQDARVSYRLGVAKGLDVRLGYGYGSGSHRQTGGGRSVFQHHDIDAGLNFNRQLSFSRKTTLSFSTGLSANGHYRATYFRLIGNANLSHAFSRTWFGSLKYSRRAEYAEYLQDVLFGDSVNGSLNGSLGGIISVRASVGASSGVVGFGAGQNGATRKFASAGISRSLTSYLALNGDYTYFSYAFEADALLRVGLPRQRQRQSVRLTLTLWAPVYSTRSANAPR